MYEIHVRQTIAAPIDRVFEAVSDHERFFTGPAIDECRLVTEGPEERNGVGAFRKIRTGGFVFTEEIVRFERPDRFDYIIRELLDRKGRAPPVEHELGWVVFSEADGGTRIEWRSRFRVTTPVLGFVLERIVGAKTARAFTKLLELAKERLEDQK